MKKSFFPLYIFLLHAATFLILPTSPPLFALALKFDTTSLHFNNLDFRDYNSDLFIQENQNTDDRGTAIFGRLTFNLDLKYKKTTFFMDISRQGYWGTDNFQGRDQGQNPVLMNRLYFVYNPSESFSLSFGRQFYQIGEAHTDFFFTDVVDGIQVNYEPFDFLKLHFLFDIVALAFRPPNINIYSIVNKDDESLDGFQGDSVNIRFGFSPRFAFKDTPSADIKQNHWLKEIGFIPFSYLLRYGASTQGSADLAENGRNTLNQADNDFLSLSGLRIYAKFKNRSKIDMTLGYSHGKDTQFTMQNNRVYNHVGFALNYEVLLGSPDKPYGSHKFFTSLGYFHQDFASMNSRSMGGMLVWGLNNYRVAPYAYFYHFRDNAKRRSAPERVDKTNSKTFVKIGDEWRLGNFLLNAVLLALLQTEDFQYMGTEIELGFAYLLDNIKVALTPAVYLPSDYYPRLAENNAFIPGGTDPHYAVRFVTKYVLDLDFILASKKEDEEIKDRTEELLDQPSETIDQ